jgi:hypothetical protein
MISRNISFEEVEKAICEGEIIKDYPEDKPFHSFLVLAVVNQKSLHIVVSQDEDGICFVISAYEPDRNIWESDLKHKKQ